MYPCHLPAMIESSSQKPLRRNGRGESHDRLRREKLRLTHSRRDHDTIICQSKAASWLLIVHHRRSGCVISMTTTITPHIGPVVDVTSLRLFTLLGLCHSDRKSCCGHCRFRLCQDYIRFILSFARHTAGNASVICCGEAGMTTILSMAFVGRPMGNISRNRNRFRNAPSSP